LEGPGTRRLRVDIQENGDVVVSYLDADDVVVPHSKIASLTPSDVADIVVGKILPPFPEETTPLSEAKTRGEAVDIIFDYICRVLSDRGVKLITDKFVEQNLDTYKCVAKFCPEYKGKSRISIYHIGLKESINIDTFSFSVGSEPNEIEFVKKTTCKAIFLSIFGDD
jgi:hypothetical protein